MPIRSLLCAAAMLAAGPALAQDAAVNDPESCAAIWQAVGVPEQAEDAPDPVIAVCHLGYIAGHDSTTKTPDWVVEHLTSAIVQGKNTRPGSGFSAEPNLPTGTPRAVDDDYKNNGGGYDRGHQAPSNDFKSSADMMADTFYFSNVVPQIGLGFNRGIWKDLEALVAKLAINRGDLYVITGPVEQRKKAVAIKASADGCGNALTIPEPPEKSIGADVAVPAALYKIVYDPGLGRLNAFVLPNLDHTALQDTTRDLDYLVRYRVGLGTVEKLTGLTFMTALDDRERRILEQGCPATMLH